MRKYSIDNIFYSESDGALSEYNGRVGEVRYNNQELTNSYFLLDGKTTFSYLVRPDIPSTLKRLVNEHIQGVNFMGIDLGLNKGFGTLTGDWLLHFGLQDIYITEESPSKIISSRTRTGTFQRCCLSEWEDDNGLFNETVNYTYLHRPDKRELEVPELGLTIHYEVIE